MKKYLPLCMIGFLAVCFGCDTQRVYEGNYDFENKSWHLDTIPSFTFEINDTYPKDVFINLRNTTSYPYQNAYITFLLEDSVGTEITSELVNFQLFNEKTGAPYGKGNSIYQHRQLVLDNYPFPYQGSFSLKTIQYMREIDLPEILSVGVRIEKAENGN